MEKIKEFFKSLKIVVKWTGWYLLFFWAINQFLFGFDMFSQHHWWKFFHGTFHGFFGVTFQIIMYSALPIYIATCISCFRNQEYVIQIPFLSKFLNYVKSKFSKQEPESEEIPESQETFEETQQNMFPEDLPRELHVPFIRAKNKQPLKSAVSAYNQQRPELKKEEAPILETTNSSDSFPIPMDFDLEETADINTIPTFKDIDFDTPIMTESEPQLKNETTKYFDKKKIAYEPYKDFVATEKYLIYEHNSSEFWIMDEDVWFASGISKDSPIPEMLTISRENGLIPVIYFATQNIMNIDETSENFESRGIRVIKSLEELD